MTCLPIYLDCIHCSLNFLCLCLRHWICLCLCLSPRGPKKWWKSCYKRSNLEKEGGRGIRSEDKQCDRVDRTNPTSLILTIHTERNRKNTEKNTGKHRKNTEKTQKKHRKNTEKNTGNKHRKRHKKQCDRVDRTNPTSLILNKTLRRKKTFLI